jgi:hypothetical protein
MGISPRRSIAITFAAFGLGFGLWAGASAALIARADVSVGLFGLGLTAFTAVYLIAMGAVSTLARLSSVKAVVIGALIVAAPTVTALLTAASPQRLIGGLILYGLAAGVLDSAMNAEAAACERQMRRPILARFHGVASGAVAIGAILGSLLVQDRTIWIAPALATLGYALAIAAVASRPAIEGRAPGAGEIPVARVITGSLVVIGLVAGVSVACETAALTWSPSLLSRDAPQLAALAGLGGAFFAGCQSLLRLNADGLRARIDDRSLMASSLAVAAMGFLLVASPLGFAARVLGFAIVGFGTGAVVPCAFALAGTRPGVSAAASISAVAFFGIFARVPTPVAVGYVAGAYSLPVAFVALAALLTVAASAVVLFVPAPKIALGRVLP